MASRSIKQRLSQWLMLLPALLLPALGLWPDAAFSERGPQRLTAPALAAAVADDEDPNNARVIVKYREGSGLAREGAGAPRHAVRLGRQLALTIRDGHVLGGRTQSLKAAGLSSADLAARLATLSDVEWAVPARRKKIAASVPNDPYYGANRESITPTVGQWYLRPPDSTALAAINAEGAWALSTGSASITVAVIDTGVRFDHPDLVGKLWPGYDFVRSSISNDGDGSDDDAADPGDYTSASQCASGTSSACSSWHGTQVAGLIGASTDNNLGMASVGRQVMVLPVRALGAGGGWDDDIIAGMLWAAGLSNQSGCDASAVRSATCNPHPAKVLNLSLGSAVNSCSKAYTDAIAKLTAASVTVVVAAGNGTGLAVNEPANCSGVIAVAGLRHAGTKVGYSNLGPQVALAAPAGNCVNETGACLYPLLTTVNTGLTTPGINTYSDSNKPSLGTSFASPLVAGTAALMLSVDPSLTPARIKAVLQATARDFPTTGAQTAGATACAAPSSSTQVECYCTTSTCGAGMLDTGGAVAQVYTATLAPKAVISASTSAPTAGDTVLLDGKGSTAAAGRSIAAYQWAISGGTGQARFVGAVDGSTASLLAVAAGDVQLSLTVTDSAGLSRSTAATINVAAAPVVVTPPVVISGGGGGGGGGAMGWGWMAGLACAVGLLARRRAG